MINEYNCMGINNDIRKLFIEMKKNLTIIANFPQISKKNIKKHLQVNLNTLIFRPERAPPTRTKSQNVIYYGMFRKDRETYFLRYFDDRMIVSTSLKNILLFKQIGIRAQFARPFMWGKHSTLEIFRYSLYIEDVFTHTHYNYPANRFYEALMFNVLQLFDKNCAKTFERAGYDVADYIVEDADSMHRKIKTLNRHYSDHLSRQRVWKRRASVERKETIAQLRPIFQ